MQRRTALLIFTTLLVSYAYFFSGSGFNQNATFDLTRSLVERQRLDIDPYASNTADVSFHDGHVYSNKAPGLAFAAALPYSVIYAVRGVPHDAIALALYLWVCTVAVCGVSGALIGVILFDELSVRGLPPRHAALLALLAGLGTPLFAYSTMLFAHVPSALLLLVAWRALRQERPIRAGAAIGAATTINYLCAPLALILLFFTGSRRSAIRFIAGGLPFAIALAAYQLAAFGSPFRTSIATMNPAFVEKGATLGIFHLPRLDALWGITFSPFRGLFYLSPILLLAVLGLRDRLIATIFVVLLALNASFNGWHGGYTVGPRYLVPAIPLLILGVPFFAARLRLLTGTLAAISILFNVAVTVVDPQPPDVLRDPIARYALPALITGRAAPDSAAPWLRELYTGHTSTNRVAADEMLPFKRHAPGSPESEWASFNLGEIVTGPGSAASLLPWLALVVALTLAWWRDPRLATRTTRDTQTERSRSA